MWKKIAFLVPLNKLGWFFLHIKVIQQNFLTAANSELKSTETPTHSRSSCETKYKILFLVSVHLLLMYHCCYLVNYKRQSMFC